MHRYAIGQYVDSSGDVISHLNVSRVRTDDGGLYKCTALNTMGMIEYSARLNVYGMFILFYIYFKCMVNKYNALFIYSYNYNLIKVMKYYYIAMNYIE